ncbi:hypothetical protein GEMRC1_013753 [Eukaryota sp. GEM-RC1]
MYPEVTLVHLSSKQNIRSMNNRMIICALRIFSRTRPLKLTTTGNKKVISRRLNKILRLRSRCGYLRIRRRISLTSITAKFSKIQNRLNPVANEKTFDPYCLLEGSRSRPYPHTRLNGHWVYYRVLGALLMDNIEVVPCPLQASHLCGHDWCVNPNHLCFESALTNRNREYCHDFIGSAVMCRHPPNCFTSRLDLGRTIIGVQFLRKVFGEINDHLVSLINQ